MAAAVSIENRTDEIMRRLDLATWWAKVAAVSATAVLLVQIAPVLHGLTMMLRP